MDGNGRWAERRQRPRTLGHRAGVKAVQVCIEYCLAQGIEALTLFAFSSENWNRPQEEVGALMKLFLRMLDSDVDELHRRGVRVAFIGDRPGFPEAIRARMAVAETLTRGTTRLVLTIAASYGGRWDIAQACRQLATEAAAGAIDPATIDEAMLQSRLGLADLPEPDLFIRTGGDLRVSNFLLWQIAYAEIYVTPTLFPDFRRPSIFEAIIEYQKRDRRFGDVKSK